MKPTCIFLLTAIALYLATTNETQAQNFTYETYDRPWRAEVGIGPGWTYADASSSIRGLGFAVMPAVSASLARSLTPSLFIKGTLGAQGMLGDAEFTREQRIAFGEEGNAYHYRGQLFYFDIAPVYRIFQPTHYVFRSKINFYGSIGIGVLATNATYDIKQGEEPVTVNNNIIAPYVPVRAGVAYRFRPLWDFALEGSVLVTFTDDLDGHRGLNRFDDYPMNIQLKVRKLFSFELMFRGKDRLALP